MVEAVEYPSFLLQIHIVYMKSILACSYAADVDRHLGAHSHCYTIGQVDPDLGNLGMVG